RAMPTSATSVNSMGQRVSSASSLRMFCTVLKPISGSNSAKASRLVKKALFSAGGSRADSPEAGATAGISNLLHVRPSEQPLRQEDHGDGENGEDSDILVIDREIGRPESLDQADQQSADHRARKRADAAEHGGGKCLDARNEAVGEAHHSI